MIKYYFSFPSTEEAFKISDDIFAIIIDTIDVNVSERQRLKLIVSELYMNAYLHGNRTDATRYIDVSLGIGENEFATIVKDEGSGISSKSFEEMVESAADPECAKGRGIRIVHKLSDRVRVFKDENGKFCVKAVRKLANEPIPAIN
jgi:anti-sigma regulatory factor (Ser/Thr protein kinase)